MEAQHKEQIAAEKSVRLGGTHQSLPQVLTGTHTEGTPATMDPRNLSDVKPQDVNRELLERLNHGMQDLAYLRKGGAEENNDP